MTRRDPDAKRPSHKVVFLTVELAARVDDYRWGNRIGSESEAIRQLIRAGLDALSAKANDR